MIYLAVTHPSFMTLPYEESASNWTRFQAAPQLAVSEAIRG
jgi:hypothetical protein